MSKREDYLSLKNRQINKKYIIDYQKPVGEGGTGIVYSAKQIFEHAKGVQLKRAIKFFIYRDDLMTDADGNLRIASESNYFVEIENISRLNHQNILKIIDGDYYTIKVKGKNIRIPYTVTEFVEGKNMEEFFGLGAEVKNDKRKQLSNHQDWEKISSEEVVFDLIIEIISAVEYLHNNNFYHCDIAPKNIFLQDDKQGHLHAILGDLGSGHTIIKGDGSSGNDKKVIGTRKYMPTDIQEKKDEIISHEEFQQLQPRWDIYSVVFTIKEIIE